jgi:hypothetical protein
VQHLGAQRRYPPVKSPFPPRLHPRVRVHCQHRSLYAIALNIVDFPKKKGPEYRYLGWGLLKEALKPLYSIISTNFNKQSFPGLFPGFALDTPILHSWH